MKKSESITKKKRGRKKKPEKVIIIDFGGRIPKARFINTTKVFFRGFDLDIAYKVMRRGYVEYKRKIREKLEKENSND